MPQRSENYPLDTSTRYSTNTIYKDLNRLLENLRRGPVEQFPFDNGEMTNKFVYRFVLDPMWKKIIEILAYLDLIDRAQERDEIERGNTQMRLVAMDNRLTTVIEEVASLKASVNTLIAFFGVTIPAWANKNEVENGDDMGMVLLSAAELGIVVAFEYLRQHPGFGHEDVVSIEPPAGALIARGSTVKVTLNLLG